MRDVGCQDENFLHLSPADCEDLDMLAYCLEQVLEQEEGLREALIEDLAHGDVLQGSPQAIHQLVGTEIEDYMEPLQRHECQQILQDIEALEQQDVAKSVVMKPSLAGNHLDVLTHDAAYVRTLAERYGEAVPATDVDVRNLVKDDAQLTAISEVAFNAVLRELEGGKYQPKAYLKVEDGNVHVCSRLVKYRDADGTEKKVPDLFDVTRGLQTQAAAQGVNAEDLPMPLEGFAESVYTSLLFRDAIQDIRFNNFIAVPQQDAAGHMQVIRIDAGNFATWQGLDVVKELSPGGRYHGREGIGRFGYDLGEFLIHRECDATTSAERREYLEAHRDDYQRMMTLFAESGEKTLEGLQRATARVAALSDGVIDEIADKAFDPSQIPGVLSDDRRLATAKEKFIKDAKRAREDAQAVSQQFAKEKGVVDLEPAFKVPEPTEQTATRLASIAEAVAGELEEPLEADGWRGHVATSRGIATSKGGHAAAR